MSIDTQAVLSRLRDAADAAWTGFPTTRWRKVAGAGPDALELSGSGAFHGLTLEPGVNLVLESDVEVPASVAGVPLAGDTLEAVLFSLYGTDISVGGKEVFCAGGVPVAAGPALIALSPALREGANGPVRVTLCVPDNQTTTWFQMRLTTPGLRSRYELIDVAWARLALSEALAATAEERAAVRAAAAAVPDPLPEDAARLAEVAAAVGAALDPLAVKAAAIKVHLVGHSHIDMNWLWTWPDTVEVIQRDVRSVLALMDEFPELTFSHSQPATYEVVRHTAPDLYGRVLQHIDDGRWEPISMTWVEGDVNMASGEGLVRQLLEGVVYTRDALGYAPDVLHSPDTFGHAGNLPQLAVSAGARFYYHHRANPGREDQWPAYWWQGQDGSRLLAISTPSYNGEIHARDLAQAAIRAHRWGHPVALHFHGIGDHGGGPSRQNLEAFRRFQATSGLPSATCSTLRAFGRALIESGVALPEHRGESSTIFEGCYTTHADTKLYNRHGENLLCTADTLTALAGVDRSEELGEAWRAVLFNQFHDILDGSAIHEVYTKNREDFEGARDFARSATEAALQVLQAGIAPGRVAVTNPHGFEAIDWVVAPGLTGQGPVRVVGDHGHSAVAQYVEGGLGFVARVPAFGTVSYGIEAGGETAGVTVAPSFSPADGRLAPALDAITDNIPYLRVETTAYRAYVRRDCGVIVGLQDLRTGRELVAFGMRRASDYVDTARPELALNVLQITDERPHGMSAWQLHEVHTEHSLISGARTSVIETGPARCVLQVRHTVRSSRLVQRIAFYRDLDRIDFELDADWQEVGSPESGVPGLKASFTASLLETEAWFETPFAAVRRAADGQEVPALRWADVGGDDAGIAVLNDSKYGCDALGCRLRLTLLRSAYDPDAVSDKGRHQIRYALLPHAGSWREAGVVQGGLVFNQPLLARVAARAAAGQAPPAPLVSGASNVMVSCLKRARSGSGVVMRLYESHGRAGQAVVSGLPAGATVTEVSVTEDRIGPMPLAGDAVRLNFRPWQVRSLLIEAV
ncbi:MAG TPA: glycoside hydrolase family 38 C-terminal domain-containing protein [Chthonomonadales bacterium]|nr:glycoside hydrolase family 38 C-terminal domain-containing protein [Chthonomonadales bacterium]